MLWLISLINWKCKPLKYGERIFWMPILGVMLQSQPNHQTELCHLGAAHTRANIKVSTVNSNFRCSAPLLSVFLQVTAAWQALPGHCPAVSGVAQQTESALHREAAAYRRGAVSANTGTVPKEKEVWGEYSAVSAAKSASSLISAVGFCCCFKSGINLKNQKSMQLERDWTWTWFSVT